MQPPMTSRDTPAPSDHRPCAPPETVDVAIVGGGIAGLYQGFVEGALRSAAEVLTGPPLDIKKDALLRRERRLGRTRRCR